VRYTTQQLSQLSLVTNALHNTVTVAVKSRNQCATQHSNSPCYEIRHVLSPEWSGSYCFSHIAIIALITIIFCFWVKMSVRVLRKGFVTFEYQRREDSSRRCPLLHILAFFTPLPQTRSPGQTPYAASIVPPFRLGRRMRQIQCIYRLFCRWWLKLWC
jgi:hypothetical protein